MSLLGDFAGNFLQIAGQQGMQREEEDRQLRLREALDARRRKLDRQDRNEDYVTEQNLGAKPYVGYDAQGKAGLLQDEYAMGEAGPSRNTRRLGDAPVSIERRGTRKTAEGTVTGAWMTNGEFIPDGDLMPPRQSGGSSRAAVGDDGLTAYQREQLKRTDAREERLSNQSGKGSGGMTEKGWREGMDQTLSSIQGAEDGKLKSIIRQYGGDNILTGDMDTNMLRDTAFSVAETYWNERKPGNKKASELEPKKADSPPVAGATKAPDGFWYVQKNGKWFKVEA